MTTTASAHPAAEIVELLEQVETQNGDWRAALEGAQGLAAGMIPTPEVAAVLEQDRQNLAAAAKSVQASRDHVDETAEGDSNDEEFAALRDLVEELDGRLDIALRMLRTAGLIPAADEAPAE